MTHQAHPTVVREAVQLLSDHGFDGMAQAMELLLNECMKIERRQAIGVGPYQRSEARRGQANGFKPRTLKTRIGPLELAVPQVRGASFYPHALEKGSRYEKVRQSGCVVDCAVLLAIGVDAQGRRSVLGVSVSLSEAEVHRREFFKSLLARGLHGVELIVSDAHAGLKEARQACFHNVPWQRCQFHLLQNALHHVPRQDMKREVMDDLHSVLDAADQSAEEEQLQRAVRKYQPIAPKLAAWMEENVPESLSVFRLPATHRRRLRTTNMLERLNRELKRRTRVATLFPNEASLLRLITFVLIEVSEEWETGKRYVTFEAKCGLPPRRGR